VRFGTRIFLWYIAIFLVCFSYPMFWMFNNLRTRYLEGVEDPLADQATILAAWVGTQMEAKRFEPEELFDAFAGAYSRPLSAQIYTFTKTHVDMRIYITDTVGKVVFDSGDPSRVGEDYSRWRDVHLTLRGEYGTRTSRTNPDDPASTTLYVAAPIIVRGNIAGVLTVAKPITTISRLIESAKPQIVKVVGISAAAAVLLSFLVAAWMSRPIKRLTRYANDVREGKRAPMPSLDRSEIGEMGKAFERMRESLEGKNYVEHYVQTLTHEVKSPLSAIRGAAELLEEERMEPERRARFLANIKSEANRIQDFVERLLELSTLENLKILEKREKVAFCALVKAVLEAKEALLTKRALGILCQIPSNVVVEGEPFLLHQAVSNLVQNAIDFSPAQGRIELVGETDQQWFVFTVRDHGPGIPDYARKKAFDKFFSLPRPDTNKKSTGLGLNFVREVAVLHKGTVTLENCADGGACATLTLPLP
jgi:two-component system sensor histidine kinase CreC